LSSHIYSRYIYYIQTIKILLHRRKDEIETLLLASSRFIRLPFLIEGLFIGTLGGVISSLAILGIYSFIMYKMVEFLPAIKFAVSAYGSVQLSLMVCLLFSSSTLISKTASETVIPSTVAHSWERTSWVTRRKAAIVPLSGLCAP
jgi:cell division protein FtsX